MTYIVGIKTKDSVFIIADQAVTREGSGLPNPINDQSAFEERHVVDANRTVSQEVFKIRQIQDNLLVGLAGDVEYGNSVIENIHRFVEYNSQTGLTPETLKKYVLQAAMNFYVVEPDRGFSIVIGYYHNETPYLLTYQAGTQVVVFHPEGFIERGIMTELAAGRYSTITRLFIEEFLNTGVPDEYIVPFLTAILQSHTIHANLMEDGVGGAFVGAQINNNGVNWQSTVIYVIYHSRVTYTRSTVNLSHQQIFHMRNAVAISHVKNFIAVTSQARGNSWLFKFKKGGFDLQEALEAASLHDAKKLQPEFVVFLSADKRAIHVFKNGEHAKQFFKVDRFKERGFSVVVYPTIIDEVIAWTCDLAPDHILFKKKLS